MTRKGTAEEEVAATGESIMLTSNLYRVQTLMVKAADVVRIIGEAAKTPDEARFIVSHVRDAIEHWRPVRKPAANEEAKQ